MMENFGEDNPNIKVVSNLYTPPITRIHIAKVNSVVYRAS
jgi:hypothetical protein